MPRINITESERVTDLPLDATSNVVLVPLVVKADTTGFINPFGKTPFAFTSEVAEKESGAYKYLDSFTEEVESGDDILHIDDSYYYGEILNRLGLQVIFCPVTATGTDPTTVDEFKARLDAAVSGFFKSGTGVPDATKEIVSDKNHFNFKFITSGAHSAVVMTTSGSTAYDASNSYDTQMLELAANNGDCIALIDLPETLNTKADIISLVSTLGGSNGAYGDKGKYGCITFPHGTYFGHVLPGSFGYLSAYANSIITYPDYYAVAGVTRGIIPGLEEVKFNVSDPLMHVLQGDDVFNPEATTPEYLKTRVNCIMDVGSGYGIKLWGNGTAYFPDAQDTYFKFLNVRILLCDIKKQIYAACRKVIFEPNDYITWSNFKTQCNYFLDRAVDYRGLDYYYWNRLNDAPKGTIRARLTIKPVEAVENFDVDIYLTDQDATAVEVAEV